jgi:multidrug transporter EmrE-like cation transporter
MPSAETALTTGSTRRSGELGLTVAVLGTLVAALLPVLRVANPGWWLLGSVVLAALVLGAGYVARRFQLPAVAVSLIEAAVWVLFMTLVFLNETALLWVIPTPESVREVPLIVGRAAEEISLGAAPLDDTVALSFMIVGAMGLLAIIIDHVVVTARMPLLAAIGIVAVSLIPAIVVRDDVDVMGFVLLAVAILVLLRAETRSREKPLERDAERTAGVPATALGIGAIAIVVAVVATPLLPPPPVRAGTGIGPGGGIDATLRLGDDLRRPQEVEVIRVRTTAGDHGVAIRRRGVGGRPRADGAARERPVARCRERRSRHPRHAVHDEDRSHQSEWSLSADSVSGHRGHGLERTLGRGALQPHRRGAGGIDSGTAVSGAG